MTVRGIPADLVEKIAIAIESADAAFGYSIRLVRLVDGESTYSLTMPGHDEALFSSYDDAAEEMADTRKYARARAVLAALCVSTRADPVGPVCGLCKGHGTLDYAQFAMDPCPCRDGSE